MKRTSPAIYGRAIQSIPILGGLGWLMAIAGFAAKIEWLARFGVIIFLCSFSVWGIANGGALAWAMKEGIRADGWRAFTSSPWSSAIFILLLLFFFGVGMFIVWFIVSRW